MDPNTGHLINLLPDQDPPEGYDRIPEALKNDATAALAEQPETYVNLKKRTPLAKWAKQVRRERQKRAKQARKRNRKK